MSDLFKVRLGDIAKVKGGKRLPAGSEFSSTITAHPYLRVTDMVNSTINEAFLVFVSPEIEQRIRNYKISKDDLYVTIAGTLGNFGTIPDKLDQALLTENAAKITGINYDFYDKNFIKYYLTSDLVQSQITKVIGIGGGVPKLPLYRIEALELELPKFSIQKYISAILSSIDSVISKTETAIEKYKSIKQGLMQDLFTRGIDVKTGKLRLSYNQAPELYKQTKLGFIPKDWDTTINLKSTYIKGRIGWEGLKASEFIKEGSFLVTGTDLLNGKIDWSTCYHISEFRFQEAPSIHLRNDDLVITKDGTIGKTAIVKNCPEKAILNSGLFVMRCKDYSYYNKFLYYILNTEIFYSHLRKTQGGSTINHLYQREFEKFEFPIPSKPEQEKIITTLENQERKIEQEENYLNKIKNIKTGLMQVLLTSKKRVKLHEKAN
ncbi:MAG: restriction endonuclease subunit S [Melioribacteraceae bacterium]|nr:restriction endonuclease subunit S [Melioribacteraceae bacterium]